MTGELPHFLTLVRVRTTLPPFELTISTCPGLLLRMQLCKQLASAAGDWAPAAASQVRDAEQPRSAWWTAGSRGTVAVKSPRPFTHLLAVGKIESSKQMSQLLLLSSCSFRGSLQNRCLAHIPFRSARKTDYHTFSSCTTTTIPPFSIRLLHQNLKDITIIISVPFIQVTQAGSGT